MSATEPITPDRWRQLDAILDAALDMPPADRSALLDRACGASALLRAAAERWLRGCEQADTFLEQAAPHFAAPMLAADVKQADPDAPDSVGPYRIIREAGRGGMGVVYLAERDDEQGGIRVALKLAQRGVGSDYLARRFLDERQILASLDHPGIARLLDGGVTADGRAYLVMEYVEGVAIDRYCGAHALSLEARLDLFRAVCDPVHFAHCNLVVHRDLKPSNVFVTGGGAVKLLDFGIAKLLSPNDATRLAVTHPGLRIMTPEYASPEQILGGRITTASDVYSLGVLLYVLLAERHPFATAGRSPRDIERLVVEADPPLPSTVAVGGSARRLVGDLDTIVGKAMRKDPEARYATAEQLAADVRRYLVRLPVIARPSS